MRSAKDAQIVVILRAIRALSVLSLLGCQPCFEIVRGKPLRHACISLYGTSPRCLRSESLGCQGEREQSASSQLTESPLYVSMTDPTSLACSKFAVARTTLIPSLTDPLLGPHR